MTCRSILPAFLRRQMPAGRSWAPCRRRLSSLPSTPAIDRSEAEGVSLVELARIAQEAGQ